MKTCNQNLGFEHAICYSGYRENQSPIDGIFPSYEEIHEDLKILKDNWSLLRLYDCSLHAKLVLKVIRNESIDLKVMLGADMAAEEANPNCPWGAVYSHEELLANRQRNDEEIERLIDLAKRYPDLVHSASVGNEASVDWSDHIVPVDRLISFVKKLQSSIDHPVTFC